MELGGYLRKSIGTGLARSFFNTAVAALFIPLIVAQVGLEVYGIWALVLIFSNVVAVADLGLAKSLVYFIPKHAGDREKSRFYSAGFLLNSALVVLLGVVGLVVYLSGIDIWGGAKGIDDELGRAILAYGVIIACAGLATSIYRAVLESYYLIYWVNVGYIVLVSLTYFLVYLLSLTTASVEHYLASTAAVHLLVLVYHIVMVRLRTGARLGKAERSILKQILGYALGFFSLGAINFSVKPLNRYLLMVISGDPAMHGIFDIGLKIGRAAFGLLSTIAAPMFSVFSSYGRQRIAEINRILNRYLLWSSGLYLLGCAAFYFGGSYILEKFTGIENIKLLFEVALIILIGNAAFGLAEPFVRAFWGLGDLGITLRIKLLQPLTNIVLILALSSMAPIYRFSWSFSIAFALSAVVMLVAFKTKYGAAARRPAAE